jgi:2-oxoglutarate dehydrogenase E2 component (dihydrolipoamide succinyltransferase)
MHEITIPTLNANDVEYEFVEWLVAAGEPVSAGQPVALIETSKAAEELEAGADGRLDHALPAGTRYRPGTVIGWVLGAGERRPAGDGQPAVAAAEQPDGPVLTASARELIAQHNVTSERVRALGKRVVRGADVLDLLGAEAPTAQAGDPGTQLLPLSRLQQAIAATVTSSLAVPAAFTLVKIYLPEAGDRPGVAEQVIHATAALREQYPAFFGRLTGQGTLAVSPGAHIGITFDLGHGLYMPVLRHAQTLSMREISTALLRFSVQARRGRFTASELSGCNIGMTLHTESAVVFAQPIIHPGTSCALAVCATLDEYRPAPDGSMRLRQLFHLGISYDHRVINGRDAVLFLDAIKRAIEGAGAA